MDHFFLNFPIDKSINSISHQDKLTFLGSCFSNEISKIAQQVGFNVLSNPYGTLFHPIPIAKNINQVIHNQEEFSFLERGGSFYSWDASTVVNSSTENELRQLVQHKNIELKRHLSEPGYLFITFGSAFCYQLKESNKIIANCHKQPNYLFDKSLSEVYDLIEVWERVLHDLSVFNSNLKVIFTVSPVRHVRDGIIENNRSKSRLIQLVEKLCSTNNATYFPSYEIIMDELRDYRFFKSDRIHPNEEAISYVWNRFSETYFNDSTKEIVSEFKQIRKRLAHISIVNQGLDEKTLKLKEKLEVNFDWIKW